VWLSTCGSRCTVFDTDARRILIRCRDIFPWSVRQLPRNMLALPLSTGAASAMHRASADSARTADLRQAHVQLGVLVSESQTWTDQCNFSHDLNNLRAANYGENLAQVSCLYDARTASAPLDVTGSRRHAQDIPLPHILSRWTSTRPSVDQRSRHDRRRASPCGRPPSRRGPMRVPCATARPPPSLLKPATSRELL